MQKPVLMVVALLMTCHLSIAHAQLAEINLVQPLDEPRGWCVDLFAHLTNAMPLGGFQGHTCFTYMGRGPTEDQGFEIAAIKDSGKFRLAYFNMCMTMQEPRPGSYVGAEPCVDEPAQKFTMQPDGRIVSASSPQLCLTLGDRTVPGGGRLVPAGSRPPANNFDIPQIRRLSFETCSAAMSKLQTWQLRTNYARQTPNEPSVFMGPGDLQPATSAPGGSPH